MPEGKKLIFIDCTEDHFPKIDFINQKIQAAKVPYVYLELKNISKTKTVANHSDQLYLFAHGHYNNPTCIMDEKKEISLTKLANELQVVLMNLTKQKYFSNSKKPVLNLIICYAAGKDIFSPNSIAANLQKILSEIGIYINIRAHAALVVLTSYFPGKQLTANSDAAEIVMELNSIIAKTNSYDAKKAYYKMKYNLFQHKNPYSRYLLAWEKNEDGSVYQALLVNDGHQNVPFLSRPENHSNGLRAKL